MKLQIQWYDYLCTVAAGVELQCTEDSQVLDPDYEQQLSSPTSCAWTSIITAVSLQLG